eukprot:2206023-Pyramimonas_sp.AAC.1
MNPKAGSRRVNPRLQGHCCVVGSPELTGEELQALYEGLVVGRMERDAFPKDVYNFMRVLIQRKLFKRKRPLNMLEDPEFRLAWRDATGV